MNQLLWLAALLGFFTIIAMMLVGVHRSSGNPASLSDLVLNAHGKFDIAAVAFWIGYMAATWVLVYCVVKGSVPEGLGAIYTLFVINCVAPLLTKIIKGKAVPPPDEKPA